MDNEGEGKNVIDTGNSLKGTVVQSPSEKESKSEFPTSKVGQKSEDKKVNGWQKKILGIPVWGWVVFGLVLVWSGIIIGIVVYR